MSSDLKPRDNIRCRCGRLAKKRCRDHRTYFCQRCRCPIQHPSDEQRRSVQEPFRHKAGAMKPILGEWLWLGDRFDAEELKDRDDKWRIIAVLDYPTQECPNEPAYSDVFKIFTNRDPEKHPYGTDWHDDPSIVADTEQLDKIVNLIEAYRFHGFNVLVHCVGGVHRSPLVVAWFMFRFGASASLEEAYTAIRQKRPEVEERLMWIPREFLDPQISTFLDEDSVVESSNWCRTKCCGWHKWDRCSCSKCFHKAFSAEPKLIRKPLEES